VDEAGIDGGLDGPDSISPGKPGSDRDPSELLPAPKVPYGVDGARVVKRR
jgi:hypothetical protein